MAPSHSTPISASESAPTARVHENILPLQLEKNRVIPKDQQVIFKLRTDPSSAISPTYQMTMVILNGTEGCRAAIKLVNDLETVCTGLNIQRDEGATKRTTIHRVLTGQAKTAFDTGYTQRQNLRLILARDAARQAGPIGAETDAAFAARIRAIQMPAADASSFAAGINELINFMSPYKALIRVKRQLRRHSRKPADMTVNEYFAAIRRINDEEIPFLPPQELDQNLGEEEVVENIYYGLPNSWKSEMARQGFDPVDSGIVELQAFCQRLEDIPEFLPAKTKTNNNSKKAKTSHGNNNTKSNSGSKGGNSKKFCLLHGNGSHTTDQCKTLQNQAENLKESRNNGSSNNKTWNRKSNDSNKELNALVDKKVAAKMKALSGKKRKSENEANVVEKLDDDLAGFNYDDMDNLQIESDDSISV